MRPDARGPHARRLGRQDDVRHPLPDGTARLPARCTGRPVSSSPTHRTVVLHMIRMARVGVEFVNDLRPPGQLRARRARHRRPGEPRSGDPGRPALLRDRRRRAHDPALRVVLRRQRAARQDRARPAPGLPTTAGRRGKFLVEQFMLIGIDDKETGKRYHICGGFPSASGKTNLAMMLAPDALGDRYHVVVLRRRHRVAVGRRGRRQALRHEPRVRGVRCRQGHQREDEPHRAGLGRTRHPALFTNIAYNDDHPRGLVGGQDASSRRPTSPAGATGRAS